MPRRASTVRYVTHEDSADHTLHDMTDPYSLDVVTAKTHR